METNIITLIAQTGGTMGLAIFAIWMLNRVWEDRVKSADRYASDLHEIWDITHKALEQNTSAIVRLLEKMDQ